MAFRWELGGSPPNPFPQAWRVPNSFFVLALFLASFACPSVTRAEPRFGDSTWVAPRLPGDEKASDPGPRVAEPDHERTWETVLRTPFRVVFLPLRMVARGTEAAVAFGFDHFPRSQHSTQARGIKVSPTFLYFSAAGLGVGPSISVPSIVGPGSSLKLIGTWSTRDTREARLKLTVGEGVSAIGFNLVGAYDYRPNQRFYGIGNDSRVEDRSIYLNHDDRAEFSVFFGRKPARRLRAIGAISDVTIGGGYQGSPLAENVFDPAEVPFLTEGTRVASFGLGGEFAALDSFIDPSRGMHVFAEARQFKSTDSNDLNYRFWRGEARGYLPVFSSRRVIAARAVYEGVDPAAGSDPVPFYRLPESTGPNRFSGFKTHRFRDQQLIVAHAEYRWLIWDHGVWALLLADAGEVAPSANKFTLDGRHSSFGGGLRGRLSASTIARLEITHSNEGMQVYIDLKGNL